MLDNVKGNLAECSYHMLRTSEYSIYVYPSDGIQVLDKCKHVNSVIKTRKCKTNCQCHLIFMSLYRNKHMCANFTPKLFFLLRTTFSAVGISDQCIHCTFDKIKAHFLMVVIVSRSRWTLQVRMTPNILMRYSRGRATVVVQKDECSYPILRTSDVPFVWYSSAGQMSKDRCSYLILRTNDYFSIYHTA